MKKTADTFIRYLCEFFNVYLPKQRNNSRHTIIAMKQTWNMLLLHICATTGKKAEFITFADLNRSVVTAFLDEMEKQKGWVPDTRNHRLSIIRSFFRYVAGMEPAHVIYLEALKAIPRKKSMDKSKTVEFLSEEAMAAVLHQPNASIKMGIRDLFFMSLMYDSAARDCEMLAMRFCDFDANGKIVLLHGKGNKLRRVPVEENTVQQFRIFSKLYHPSSDGSTPMFYTTRYGVKAAMSDDNVAKFITKYADSARIDCPAVPGNVHPHMLRRSRAVHWYRNGMPLSYIAEILGHENMETTWIYAWADTEMKRKAIEKAKSLNSETVTSSIEIVGKWQSNEEVIKRLLGE